MSSVIKFCPYNGDKIPSSFQYSEDSKEIIKFFKRSAKKSIDELISKVFVMKNEESDFVGFIALSLKSIHKGQLKSSKCRGLYDRPAIVIGQLIIDEKFQGKGYGKIAVEWVISIVKVISKFIPCRLLFVDAINDNAKRFYEKIGFESLPDPNDKYTLALDLLPILKVSE